MQTRIFGRTGKTVPIIGQGTWRMEQNPKESIQALRKGIDAGLTHIDTAEMYGSGRVEEIVGEAIRGLRERVFLVSKVFPSNASADGTMEACERSLRKLHTDALDLYLLHWAGSHPLEVTFRAFEKLEKAGKIRAFGVSNFDVEEMEEAVKIAGPDRIACNQVLYHIRERSIENTVLPWCQVRNIPIVAYSPYGQGDFPRDRDVLQEIATARGATIHQVALSFLFRSDGVFVIPKSSDENHVLENAGADRIVLSEKDVEKLETAFPKGEKKSLPML